MPRHDTDPIDIASLYQKYGPMVLRRCRCLLKSEEEALDAMQETFVKLMRYQDKLSGEYPSSLLYRIATNICLNLIRDRKPAAQGDQNELINQIACFEDPERRFIHTRLLDHLFSRDLPSTRQMAALHFVDGLTLEEVAESVQLSVSGVRKRLRLFRQRILEQEVNHGP